MFRYIDVAMAIYRYRYKYLLSETLKKRTLFSARKKFFIKNNSTSSKYPAVVEWMKELWYSYTIEYYAAMKKKEL